MYCTIANLNRCSRSQVQALEINCFLTRLLSRTKDDSLSLQVETWTSAAEVSHRWNELIPENHCLRIEKLSIFEQSNLPDLSYLYQLILKDEKPIAALYYQLISLQGKHYQDFSIPSSFSSRQISRIIRKLTIPLLVCGNLVYNEHPGYYFSPIFQNLPDASLYVNKAIQIARKYSSAHIVLAKDLEDVAIQFLNTPNGWQNPGEDIIMKLTIRPEWKQFSDYVACLSPKYASRIRKIEKNVQPIEVRELNLTEMIELSPVIEHLYQQTISKASVNLGSINSIFLIKQKSIQPNQIRCKGWFENGTMVAFCQEIIRDSQLEISYVGFDKAKNRTYSLYHHILLTGVKDAIEIGCHELYLGRTAYEAKAILGCQPILNQNRILISNPFLQVAVKQFFQWFEQQRGVEWKKRNPFRNSI